MLTNEQKLLINKWAPHGLFKLNDDEMEKYYISQLAENQAALLLSWNRNGKYYDLFCNVSFPIISLFIKKIMPIVKSLNKEISVTTIPSGLYKDKVYTTFTESTKIELGNFKLTNFINELDKTTKLIEIISDSLVNFYQTKLGDNSNKAIIFYQLIRPTFGENDKIDDESVTLMFDVRHGIIK